MAMHYKGASMNIKKARYHIRQADRILRTQYHGIGQVELLDNVYAFLNSALHYIRYEHDDAKRQLQFSERGEG